MQIHKSSVALVATTAFATLLAGCSGGGSQPAPVVSHGAGTTQSVARLRTPAIDLRGDLGNRIPRLSENRFVGTVAPGGPYLYASDNLVGELDEYTEDNPGSPIATCAGCAGWGLAVRPGLNPRLAVGKSGGTVEIYTNLASGNPAHTSTLKLSGGGEAFGICFDSAGGLWADNFSTATLDHFSAAKVNAAAGTFNPFPTWIAAGDVDVVFYLACDNGPGLGDNKLYAYGYNSSNGNVNVDQVGSGGAEAVETLVGNVISGTAYPGGLAIAPNDRMVVNSQVGTLYNMGVVEPWAGAVNPATSCTWGLNPNDVASIVWDNQIPNKEVWGVDILSGSSTSDAESFKYPLGAGGACAPGESGGPSTPLQGLEYLGVAVYPNAGN
jgi:hypothetical protein